MKHPILLELTSLAFVGQEKMSPFWWLSDGGKRGLEGTIEAILAYFGKWPKAPKQAFIRQPPTAQNDGRDK
jgi:hypothetical protein